MNEYVKEVAQQRMERTAQALRKNQMEAYCVDCAADVLPLLKTLIAPGACVSMGGSVSLQECGVPAFLRTGDYEFLDREAVTGDAVGELYRKAFFADCYLSSANAVTEQGEIFNVDGNGNRVAALAFGPQNVILVIGCNKIVEDLHEAHRRLRHLAAPANTKRLNRNTPCAKTGTCADCRSPERICCTYTIQRFSKTPGRIKVILVAEPLGY